MFEKQLSRFIDSVEAFTFYTVRGISIQSDFTLNINLVVEDKFGSTAHHKQFPIILRSKRNGDFLLGFDLLDAPR